MFTKFFLLTNFWVILVSFTTWIPQIVNGQSHMQLAGFITNDELEKCKEDLALADNDGNEDLTPDEFIQFLSSQTDGAINATSLDTAPIRLVLVYLTVACNCVKEFGIESQCCQGDNAHVPLHDHSDQYFTFFCADINESLDIVLPPPTQSPTTVAPMPTTAPTNPPSSTPSMPPTPVGSESPTKTPSTPTSPPTKATTFVPSVAPTPVGSESPTKTPGPTESPTTLAPTSSPTLGNLACFNFLYGINNNLGFTASDIFNMVGNTLKTGLEIATETVVIDTLNTTFPRNGGNTGGTARISPETSSIVNDLLKGHRKRDIPNGAGGQRRIVAAVANSNHRYLPKIIEEAVEDATLEWYGTKEQGMEFKIKQELQDWKTNRRSSFSSNTPHQDHQHRHLAFYTTQVPVEVVSVVPNLATNFCSDTDECMIISTDVCVVLEEGDQEILVLNGVRNGLRSAVGDGSFLAAVPSEHELPDLRRNKMRRTASASLSNLRVGNVDV